MRRARAACPLVLWGLVGRASFAQDLPIQQPQQIHIGLGASPAEMTVHWTTMQETGESGKPPSDPGDSFAMYGLTEDAMTSVSKGSSFTFSDCGPEKRNYTMHIATMVGLTPNKRYCYAVGGNRSGWSAPYCFLSAPGLAELGSRPPMVYAVYGDQGDWNGQTLPSLESATNARELDMVLHIGDMAYNLDNDNGRNGDAWMRDIEPIAARVPYMVSAGNHESQCNFNHYTQRFRNMPSNSGNLTFPQYGTVPNNWWYSWDSGLVHFVAISTEVYFDYIDLMEHQYAWLENDLASVNRSRTPWVIVHGHRPLYCSCDDDCDTDATRNRMGFKQADGSYKYGLEELFHSHGVDMYIAGHEHNYERMFDVAPKWNESAPWLSGVTTQSTVDPPATTYIVTGSAGSVEDHEPFTRAAPVRSASRLNTYGWSKMTVWNATHLLWQQVQTDNGQPEETWGKVMDEVWIVQRHHGPFQLHPRHHELEDSGKTGLRDVDDVSTFVEGTQRHGSCRAAGHGKQPSCSNAAFGESLELRGHWQATKAAKLVQEFI